MTVATSAAANSSQVSQAGRMLAVNKEKSEGLEA
jgi:hypothetical protein